VSTRTFVPALAGHELPPGTPVGVELDDGHAICLVRTADGVHAFDDVCPHRGTPLSEGKVSGTTLTCRAHTWEFDVRSGELLRLRAPACLTMHPARERDGMIEVAR
jgi:nitrite reductase/ring-hydroxylating ferredoxin subunit